MSSNVLFVFAHLDDESFGPAGTIAKHAAQGDNVCVYSLCRGNRPGASVEDSRQEAFINACAVLGAKPVIGANDDVFLDAHAASADITDMIREFQPEIVYTHNISDLHRDHRIVAETCVVACRPKPECSVRQLLMCEIPASTEWTFGTIEPAFTPNVFKDVTDFMDVKREALGLYSTETYEFPDARSVKSMEVMAEFRGKQVGSQFAEAFRLVFSHDRRAV